MANYSDSLTALPRMKKVFVRSGLRYDYLLLIRMPHFLRQLCADHISGQLKVAPEHNSPVVLAAMGKPNWSVYQRFTKLYQESMQH